MRGIEEMSSLYCWASFVHIGFDTTVDLKKLRHELLDRQLDQAVRASSPERFPLVTAETLDNKGKHFHPSVRCVQGDAVTFDAH